MMSTAVNEIDLRIEKCRKILKEDPYSQIFASLADCYRRKGDLEKAAEICSTGLANHPDYGSGHFVMSKIYYGLGNLSSAIEELHQAKKLMGATSAIDIFECRILIETGKVDEAKPIISRLQTKESGIQELAALAVMLPGDSDAGGNRMGSERLSKTPYNSKANININSKSAFADKINDAALTIASLVRHIGLIPLVNYVVAIGYNGEVISSYPEAPAIDEKLEIAGLANCELSFVFSNAGLEKIHNYYIEVSDRKISLKDTGKFYLLMEVGEKMNMGLINLKLSEMLPNLIHQGT